MNKPAIVTALKGYIEKIGSQNKAANSMEGVSSATISQMLNHNWDLIKDDMWRKVAAQIGHSEEDWVTVDIKCFSKLTKILADAKENSLVMAGITHAGGGKTETIKHFAAANRNVYHIKCSEFWNRKYFLEQILKSIGRDSAGSIVSELYQEVVMSLKQKEKPLLIFDEADKITDQVLYFFITLYNELEGHCGMIFCATHYLDTRMKRGFRLKKKGYEEFYSRIGRKFIQLPQLSYIDVAKVCGGNGITDKGTINAIFEDCDSDLRRVKRLVHAEKQKLNSQLKTA